MTIDTALKERSEMKVLSINPGKVFLHNGEWHFSLMFNYGEGPCQVTFTGKNGNIASAPAAKQAMREALRFERKRHGLGG